MDLAPRKGLPDPEATVFAPGIVRPAKPRSRGLTMVIDKGLGLTATEDLLQLAADHIDVVKLGFGTAALYTPEVLQRKIAVLLQGGVDVLPGGTLLEMAYYDGETGAFLAWALRSGFTYVEVSDGTVELPTACRRDLIRRAKDMGFGVWSEVGKKDPARPLHPEGALEQIERDLVDGADKVIVEGRDSGLSVGLFDDEGQLRPSLLDALVDGLSDASAVVWEAPRTHQQRLLLQRLGPEVNFGNVQPEDVVTLEAMRRGLRNDTFRLRVEGDAPAWRPFR